VLRVEQNEIDLFSQNNQVFYKMSKSDYYSRCCRLKFLMKFLEKETFKNTGWHLKRKYQLGKENVKTTIIYMLLLE
jgi:hypothetical protein